MFDMRRDEFGVFFFFLTGESIRGKGIYTAYLSKLALLCCEIQHRLNQILVVIDFNVVGSRAGLSNVAELIRAGALSRAEITQFNRNIAVLNFPTIASGVCQDVLKFVREDGDGSIHGRRVVGR